MEYSIREGRSIMTIIHTYLPGDTSDRAERQAAVHRRCLLLLQAARSRG